MAAPGHPLTSNAALDVLKGGGNTVDAALCASAAMHSGFFTRQRSGESLF
jgi:gamma-glutamyltranspeptidase